jgi:WD40 repeat protein
MTEGGSRLETRRLDRDTVREIKGHEFSDLGFLPGHGWIGLEQMPERQVVMALETGRTIAAWPLYGVCSFRAGGSLLACLGADDRLWTLFDLTTRRTAGERLRLGSRVDFTRTPDGQYLAATGSEPDGLHVTNLGTGRDVLVNKEPSIGRGFSRDGRLVVTFDGTEATVLDVGKRLPTGRIRVRGDGHIVSLSPDNRYLVVGEGRSLRLYTWQWKDLAESACRVISRNRVDSSWQEAIPSRLFAAACPGYPDVQPPWR